MANQKKLREELHRKCLRDAQQRQEAKSKELVSAINLQTYTRSLVLSIRIGLIDDFDLSVKAANVLLFNAVGEICSSGRRRKNKGKLDPYAEILKE